MGEISRTNRSGTFYYDPTWTYLHRENDLPAIEYANGDLVWYQYGEYHREGDKPARISDNGQDQEWWFEGKLHRLTGPAWINTKSDPPIENFFIHGEIYSREDFYKVIKLKHFL